MPSFKTNLITVLKTLETDFSTHWQQISGLPIIHSLEKSLEMREKTDSLSKTMMQAKLK